jgi:hypothetical protein
MWKFNVQPGGDVPIHQPNGDWLSDYRSHPYINSYVSVSDQSVFLADRRVLLVHARRPDIRVSSGSWTSTSPTGEADSFIVWLEPEPTAAADTK